MRLVTSVSITFDVAPCSEYCTDIDGILRDGDSFSGNNGKNAKPIIDRQIAATKTVNGDNVCFVFGI
jgi:hypothetical protein